MNYLLILLLILFIFTLLYFIKNNILQYPLINVNNSLVRDMEDKEAAADLMNKIKQNIKALLSHLKSKYPDKTDIHRLVEKFNPENIKETDVSDSGTSYSINKGSELSICLRDKTDPRYKLHKLNTIMFVVIHELSHIMSKSFGHNEEFGDNFEFLLAEANQAGIYNNVDYSSNKENYCGIEITSNPLL